MTFVASGNNEQTWDSQRLENGDFFDVPITLEGYRQASRIDRTAGDEQAKQALRSAVKGVNAELANWARSRVDQGVPSLMQMPIDRITQPTDFYEERYCRAVFCTADALLVESFADFDSSGEGQARGETMTPRIDTYRRESIYAIADILGASRNRVDLL